MRQAIGLLLIRAEQELVSNRGFAFMVKIDTGYLLILKYDLDLSREL